MHEIYVYHVVTERTMKLGQKIWFDETHTNGVYQRVMATKAILEHEDLDHKGKNYKDRKYKDSNNKDLDFIKISSELFHLIDSNLEKWSSVMYRELAMEKVRIEQFPEYPSRMASLYTSRSLEEAQRWAKYFQDLGRNVYGIVKLQVCGNVFDGDATLCFDGTRNEEDNIIKAYHYWKKDIVNDNQVLETLVDGEITVVEMIENSVLGKE